MTARNTKRQGLVPQETVGAIIHQQTSVAQDTENTTQAVVGIKRITEDIKVANQNRKRLRESVKELHQALSE